MEEKNILQNKIQQNDTRQNTVEQNDSKQNDSRQTSTEQDDSRQTSTEQNDSQQTQTTTEQNDSQQSTIEQNDLQQNDKPQKNQFSFLRAALLLAMIAAILLGGVTFSRYIVQWSSGQTAAQANAFYFTSDYLKENDPPVYYMSEFKPETDEIKFKVRNYADEMRFSEADIAYKINIVGETVSGSGNVTITDNGSGTLAKNSPNTSIVTLRVNEKCFNADGKAIIEVQAVSEKPYGQTISAIYELFLYDDSVTHSVSDIADSNTLVLTVTMADKDQTVMITYPAGVVPDRTDSRLTIGTGGAAKTCTFEAKAKAQYTFVFFKTNPSSIFETDNFKTE